MELYPGKDLEVIQLHFLTKKKNKSELYPRPQLPLDSESWTNLLSSLCTYQFTLDVVYSDPMYYFSRLE